MDLDPNPFAEREGDDVLDRSYKKFYFSKSSNCLLPTKRQEFRYSNGSLGSFQSGMLPRQFLQSEFHPLNTALVQFEANLFIRVEWYFRFSGFSIKILLSRQLKIYWKRFYGSSLSRVLKSSVGSTSSEGSVLSSSIYWGTIVILGSANIIS